MFTDSQYSQFIYKSRYSRYLEKENRRESWPETVKRYFDFIEDYLFEKYNFNLSSYREELENAVLRHDIMPSMRALMTAGPAAKRNHVALYNCLGGETLVTTLEYGIVPIRELAGQSVSIVDGNGNWTLSECKSYGFEDLYSVNIGTSGVGKFSFRATANHRWIDDKGNDVLTCDLKSGTSLANVSMPDRPYINENSDDYKKGIIHGIIYGDGTATFKGRGQSSKDLFIDRICDSFVIRLCGKSKELISYFDGYQRSNPKTYNGDPVIRINDAVFDLKSLPEDWVNDDYRLGFIRGWFAADGTITSKTHQASLASVKEGLEWIYKFGPRYGFLPLSNYKYPSDTNYGQRKKDLFKIEFDRRWLKKEDFLLQYKKDLFIKSYKRFGSVKSVEFSGNEEVFCFDVPTTHSFLLTKNILTRNCAYLPMDDVKSFDEEMAILMSGTGVGYSVEGQYVKNIPELPENFFESETIIVFDDSRLGWAKGFREYVSLLMIGQIPKYDISGLRPAGARLKTMGGRSSGPQPLIDLLEFAKAVFVNAAGRKLTTLEAHDIACKVADIVVVGGVRRSALISLSDLSDDRMRDAKSGNWWMTQLHRRLANNSAVYEERPDIGVFMKEWLSLYESHSGERGIISRPAMRNVIESANEFRRQIFGTAARFRDPNYQWGTNPCSEIILRPYEFCNLTEVILYEDDIPETIRKKVRLATILGTIQSCFTNFKYLNKKWQKNCEDERLLGVSLTGIYDNKYTNGTYTESHIEDTLPSLLHDLKAGAIRTNIEFAALIGIDSSVAITCVKPSGTSSALNGTSSGIHPAHAPYYWRYVRNDIKDPLTKFMIANGFPFEKDAYDPNNVVCFKFPIKASKDAIFKKDLKALDHLKLWLTYQKYWCEHKPSITVSVKENEWLEVGDWVYKNFDWVSGISFLPAEEGSTVYKQAPFTTVNETQYNELVSQMPVDIDWSRLIDFESFDTTTNTQELACVAGGCEI